MANNYKVFLTGGDNINWATDDDFRLTKKALSSFCDFSLVNEAEIVHSVNWQILCGIDPDLLNSRRVIAQIPHDVRFMLELPRLRSVAPFVDQWVVPSKNGLEIANDAGFNAEYVPYAIDPEVFFPVPRGNKKIIEFIEKYDIPSDKYLIGSFQRDTFGEAFGGGPKYIKGPDIFLEIIKEVYANNNIHVVLAGPRRFWLRQQLDRLSIPYTFIGEIVEGKDDVNINTLPHKTMNLLYNLIDLYVVASRREGGPKAILETAASRCKIISTPVGQSGDILCRDAVFKAPHQAVKLILDDINNNTLNKTVELHAVNAASHYPEKIRPYWEKIYSGRDKHECKPVYKEVKSKTVSKKPGYLQKFFKPKVTILHEFKSPPWGGGNQFLLALKKSFENRGWLASTKLSRNAKVCIFNSFTFDFSELERYKKRYYNKAFFIHRVDGPTILARGKDKELDDKVFEMNNHFADVTVFQSFWSYKKTIELGYRPVNPVIISNAVDPTIFNRYNRIPFDCSRKIRLISTSWSDNVRKGAKTYKWIEEHLDWNKFEYTFVGRSQMEFEQIKCIEPVPSKELANILRQHDIYITAGQNDACSNALIEALSCGLPALYLNDGGHPEIVGYGGLPFNSKDEILFQLDRLVENYETFQDLIVIPSIEEVADRFIALMDTNIIIL